MNAEQSNRFSRLSKSSKRFIKKSWKRSLGAVKTLQDDRRYRAIYAKHRDLTMIPRPIYIDNLRLVETVLRVNELANGCIVECESNAGRGAAACPSE